MDTGEEDGTSFSIRDENEGPSWKHPHAFHRNLPAHHMENNNVGGDNGINTNGHGNIPFITKYAYKKSRYVLRLVESLQITEAMLLDPSIDSTTADTTNNNDVEDANDVDWNGEADSNDMMVISEEDDGSQSSPTPTETLSVLMRTCARISSQLSSLESLKHSGISRLELARIILHIIKLVSATYTIQKEEPTAETGGKPAPRVTLHYEQVGFICTSQTTQAERKFACDMDSEALEQDLASKRFALPSPAREVLLSLVVNLLSNKGPLRCASNAAIFVKDSSSSAKEDKEKSSFLLILHWKALLRMLLRTAPYLDEKKVGTAPMASNSRQNTIVKRTVQLIRDARHFFDQGLEPSDPTSIDDRTAIDVWEMVKTDLMFHSHTNACYRALILLYLFQPSRCTSSYYLERMPLWFDAWSNIDRCPEMDFLWLALFCRARKHVPTDYDWGPIRRRLLTHSQYWLHLPIGGTSMDKSFPNVSSPRSRSCPSRLKVFAGASSSYEEGIDFVAKVTKLLVIGLGTGEVKDGISEGTRDVLRFMNFATPYFNPSNLGSWTFTLGAFLHYFSYELCCRIGTTGSIEMIKKTRPELAEALIETEPTLSISHLPHQEVVALMDVLLPLCQQSLYSKNGHVGRAGEAAMLYLVQIDPARATPAFVDFAMRALDISAVNLAHQAPAALSALTRLLQPALRNNPKMFLSRLPDILRLTLAGIDSNDQNKTIRTLILYRSLTSWIPVGGSSKTWKRLPLSGTSVSSDTLLYTQKYKDTNRLGRNLMEALHQPTHHPDYINALKALPEKSLLKQGNDVIDLDLNMLADEAAFASGDWALEFLDRVFSLLRATGEREKAGKTASGVANRHSSADVQQARNFSRVLKETLIQTFASMDDEIYKSAVNAVARFLQEETLPLAAKDASLLCQATCAARIDPKTGVVISPGLDALIPVLVDDLKHDSNKTVMYRLRCLAGAVRACGLGIKKHKKHITQAIEYALASKDKHVHKTGCKLLRHTLATCCESYVLACDAMPRVVINNGSSGGDEMVLGRSAQVEGDPIRWHVPDGECVEIAWLLLNQHVLTRIATMSSLDDVSMLVDDGDENKEDTIGDNSTYNFDFQEMRRCLRVIRYALRGGAGILLESYDTNDTAAANSNEERKLEGGIFVPDEMADLSLFPYEQAMHNLLKAASKSTYTSIVETRGKLCMFVVKMTSLMASESFQIVMDSGSDEDDKGSSADGDVVTSNRKYKGTLSADSKICKEIGDIALLLLTRRGAAFRSQEGKTIWKAQKQLATDFALLSFTDHMTESLQRANLYGPSSTVWYKDGEDAGKTLPRRLLVTRIQLFHDSLQRMGSYEIPRRLRRLAKARKDTREVLFSTKINIQDLKQYMDRIHDNDMPSAMDAYEGIVDGLFALCCHSNTQVRASAIGVVDYAVTRFGWLLRFRVPRLLAAVNLTDDKMHGKFGIPSCASLKTQIDGQGKRKRLAEVMKGVCSILATPRAGKLMMGSEKMRFEFISTICTTEGLVSIMPAEEMQKMVHYLHSLFGPFRLKFYSFRRATVQDQKLHRKSLEFLLDALSNEKDSESDEDDIKSAHWRKMMHACWFLTVQVDDEDLNDSRSPIPSRLWKLCFQIIENEYGQPLQRVAIGLFGRLVMLLGSDGDGQMLRDQMVTEPFCRFFGNALVYDHKEDSSVGGGHAAQWATGVADMIRDSARNIAPKSMFPFQRTNQSSGTFKISHAQLIERILLGLNDNDIRTSAKHLLSFARDMAASPPSEDQRNQQVTSAEVFAGVTRAFMQRLSDDDLSTSWSTELIPFLDEVVSKIPISLSAAYFDSIRFSIHFSAPKRFLQMTSWIFDKIENSLWDPSTAKHLSKESDEEATNNGSKQGTDGFTAQSKWLYLCSAILVELDETEAISGSSKIPWYTNQLIVDGVAVDSQGDATVPALQESWTLIREKLLPRVISALGHPYESCRDHIAACLFRICYCHRKMTKNNMSRANSSASLSSMAGESTDPGIYIVEKLLELQKSTEENHQIRCNSLITARRFFSCCIHFGETKHEFSDYIIPLIPLAFEALNSSIEDMNDAVEGDTVAKRALEAEVMKGYRYTIAELSVAPVMSYGANEDILKVLSAAATASKHQTWQVRHAAANFLRCFQGSHKFLFTSENAKQLTSIVENLLSDERREVSAAAMAAVTGIIAALPSDAVADLVHKYVVQAKKSTMKKRKKSKITEEKVDTDEDSTKEQKRAKRQQSSVFFLCATILSQPYDTPPYVPKALAAISKHSFERNAPLGVRDIVKKCCAEYKRTHMSDNWDTHRRVFTQEEIEAFEDVVSTPHYYA